MITIKTKSSKLNVSKSKSNKSKFRSPLHGKQIHEHQLLPLNAETYGYLDFSEVVCYPNITNARISGWIFCSRSKIVKLELSVNDSPWVPAYLELRPDVQNKYSFTKNALKSGFNSRLPMKRPSLYEYLPLEVKARIKTENGRIQIVRFLSRQSLVRRPIHFNSSYDRSRLELHRENWISTCKLAFNNFMLGKGTIDLPMAVKPVVSVVIVSFNHPEMLLKTLTSLLSEMSLGLELIIYDNASSKMTIDFLNRIQGAKIIFSDKNLHFLEGANAAAKIAKGEFILFLNSDCEILPGSLIKAVEIFKSNAKIGVLGPMILNCDGTVQEAGSYIREDGFTSAYGVGCSPEIPEVRFQRSVDYVSGAFLLTKRETFKKLGGFSSIFRPAYYEDVDYCLRVRDLGLDVVYTHKCKAIHYLHGSADQSNEPKRLMVRNRNIFFHVHKNIINEKAKYSRLPEVFKRSAVRSQRILYIDLHFPHAADGGGFPRGTEILKGFCDLGYQVTAFAIHSASPDIEPIQSKIDDQIELIANKDVRSLKDFLLSRPNFYDVIFVSRPECVSFFRSECAAIYNQLNAKIIYDVEALQSLREKIREEVTGYSTGLSDDYYDHEINLYDNAHVLASVSNSEKKNLEEHLGLPTGLLTHSHDIIKKIASYKSRQGFLFVGPTDTASAPNTDALIWFINEVWPKIFKKMGKLCTLTVVGKTNSSIFSNLKISGIQFVGRQEDLLPYYEKSRVFIAPNRFSAGIPHKVTEAAASGIPVVASQILVNQLGWKDKTHILSATDAQSFADACIELYGNQTLWKRIQKQAFDVIKRDFSKKKFYENLKNIIQA